MDPSTLFETFYLQLHRCRDVCLRQLRSRDSDSQLGVAQRLLLPLGTRLSHPTLICALPVLLPSQATTIGAQLVTK